MVWFGVTTSTGNLYTQQTRRDFSFTSAGFLISVVLFINPPVSQDNEYTLLQVLHLCAIYLSYIARLRFLAIYKLKGHNNLIKQEWPEAWAEQWSHTHN